MSAHIPTLFLVIIMVGSLLSMSVAVITDRSKQDGVMFWAAGLGMNTAAVVFISLFQRGHVDEFSATVLATALRSCSWAACAEGLYQFYRKAPPRKLIWAPVAMVALTSALLFDQLPLRIMLVSLIIASQCLVVLSLIWTRRHETPGRGKFFLVAGLTATITLLSLRVVGAAMGASAALASVAESSQIQTISILVSLFVLILLSLGFVLISTDRADDLNRQLATRDELTGLANRRSLNEVLASEWARAKRSGQPLALAMIDIDHFKRYNDHYGHQAGDECLKRIARDIQMNARRTGDLAARYGGEEFLLILPDADAAVALRLAEGLRKSIESLDLPHAHSPAGKVTVSVGVAALDDACYPDAESLLRAADDALYRAKDLGRNQVRVALESLPPDAAEGAAPIKLVQLIWRRAYESGNTVIDAQHLALFSDVNRLLGAVLDGRQAHEVGPQVDVLLVDIARHFQEEEVIIAAAGYAGAAQHAALHRALLGKADMLVRQFHAGTLTLGELFEFLAHEVVARHILAADRAFFRHCKPRS